ncbi:MAG: hypothetical protein U9R58_03155 [Chloroflexota bacterium]|nr:hypothetical protein [Chloroflexota bacterium]
MKGNLLRFVVYLFIIILIIVSFHSFSSTSLASTDGSAHHRVTDIRDNTLAVSWTTIAETTGEIHYGTAPTNLDQVAYDTRGASFSDDIHYIKIQALNPETLYYFDIHSGGNIDNNNGNHYEVFTGPTLSIPPQVETSYGQVFLSDGVTWVEYCIVYITLADNDELGRPGKSSPMSSLIEKGEEGYWDTKLINARLTDLSDYFSYSSVSGDEVELEAQCGRDGAAAQSVDTDNTMPAPAMILSEPVFTELYLPLTIKD